MPFYLVTQKGVPGGRLVEAEKPGQALQYVIGTQFDTRRVDGRELLDAAKLYEPESATAAPEEKPDTDPAQKPNAGDNSTIEE